MTSESDLTDHDTRMQGKKQPSEHDRLDIGLNNLRVEVSQAMGTTWIEPLCAEASSGRISSASQGVPSLASHEVKWDSNDEAGEEVDKETACTRGASGLPAILMAMDKRIH